MAASGHTANDKHQHAQVQVRTACADCGQELDKKTLNLADLEPQQISELPDREAMSLVNANLAVPVNIAAALNVLSDGSIAGAAANQNTPIDQSMLTSPATLGGS